MPDKWKRALVYLVVTLLCMGVSGWVYLQRFEVLERLELMTYDWRMQLRGPIPTSGQIVIVAFDEKSRKVLGEPPWSRSTMAGLVRALDEYKPRVVGWDVVFPVQSPGISDATDPDGQFAKALAESKTPHVMGYDIESGDSEAISGRIPHALIYAVVDYSDTRISHIPVAHNALPTFDLFSGSAGQQAFLNFTTDGDGRVRSAPLIYNINGVYYSSLPIAMLCCEQDDCSLVAKIDALSTHIVINSFTIRIGHRANFLINYRGDNYTFNYVSALDILRANVNKESVSGKYVIIGSTLEDDIDTVSTPLSSRHNITEVQASILDSLILKDYIQDKNLSNYDFYISLLICIIPLFALFIKNIISPNKVFCIAIVVYWASNIFIFVNLSISIGVICPLLGLLLSHVLLQFARIKILQHGTIGTC